jgi:YD repeat-containing protein
MKRRATLATLVGILLLALPQITRAQTNPNLQTGLTPYGSFAGGGVDTVSLTNGNLTLHVPLFSYPQRGSQGVNGLLKYNGKEWYVYQICNYGICTDTWKWTLNTVHGVTWTMDGGIDMTWAQEVPGQGGSPTVFTATTGDGASHEMVPNNAGGYETVDGTGIWYNGATNGGGVVLTRNGNQPLVMDTNGNMLNPLGTNDAWWTSSDTLDRSFPSLTGAPDTIGCVAPPSGAPFTGASYQTLPAQGGANQTRYIKLCYASYSLQTNFQQVDPNLGIPIHEGTENAGFLVSAVLCLDSTCHTGPAWGFDYVDRSTGDSSSVNYGSLSQVTLPTGGTISYTWQTVQMCTVSSALTQWSRTLTSRALDPHDGSGPRTWTYGLVIDGSGVNHETLVGDPDGNETDHFMTSFGDCAVYETQTKWYQGISTSGGTLLKTVNTDYTSSTNPYGAIYPNDKVNVLPIRKTTIWPNGKTTKVETDYDAKLASLNSNYYSYGDATAVREYDYGNGSPGPLLRTTTNTYVAFTNNSYLTANLLDLLSTQTIKDGNNNQVAQTTYSYDGSSLQSSGVTTQHNTSLPNPGVRGNRTSTCRWLNTTGGNVCTTATYYDTGMPYQVTDALGRTTTFSYSSSYLGAYVTQTNLPDTNSPNLAHHAVSGTYDFNMGELLTFTDQNSQTSSYGYDTLGRITSANFPDGGETTFTYNDAPLNAYVERQTLITGSAWDTFYAYFDGLARQKETQHTSDPSGTVYIDYGYDVRDTSKCPAALGLTSLRCDTVSNPYRSNSDSTYGITKQYSDALGRGALTVPPDGSVTSNNVLTQFCDNTTMVTDQSGNWRRSTADGLGRLIEVDEPNSTTATVNVCPGTGEPIWITSYTYDTLNNLKTAVQNGSRSRSFVYDSLSRMTSSTNPEAGSVSYGYDSVGNVVAKTDARSINSRYYYDPLNRLLAKQFSDSVLSRFL